MESTKMNTPISLSSVKINDNFWSKEVDTVRKEVIPYQWEALNDNVPGAAPSFCMHNFKVAGKLNKERITLGKDYGKVKELPFKWGALPDDINNPGDHFYGFVFQDSDFSKWIEAVAYSLTQYPDPELEKTADEAIDVVCAAQLDNGYLDTYYIISDFDQAFTDLRDNHELYCFGHLVEGACAYYQATGKDKLLNAAKKFADYIDSRFGTDEGKIKGYPGHEIAEMALVRLYDITKDKRYLKLSKYFVDERGKRPYYFDTELDRMPKAEDKDKERYSYHQAHKPIREMDEATGHAVRAVYFYSGAADVARLTGDDELFNACDRLFDNIVNKRMYVTGGIGSTHLGEAFTYDYDLPNDTAYAETCASIGLIFFARRMLQIKPDRKYSDVMERALYNGVLSGMALDGKSFFYVNPLEVNPEGCLKDERKFHVKHVRQKWFGCACCPPNIARLLSSIVSYAYTENQDTLFTHLYIGGSVTKEFIDGCIEFNIESQFPWNGDIKITSHITNNKKIHATLALRVPGWCKNILNIPDGIFKDGYIYITKDWANGDSISLTFDMEIRILMSNTNVRENIGKLCISRGPIVYCLEEIDNAKYLHNLILDPNKPMTVEPINIGGIDMNCIKASGLRINQSSDNDNLYMDYEPHTTTEVSLTFVPYYSWNNRGEGEMSVYVRGLGIC